MTQDALPKNTEAQADLIKELGAVRDSVEELYLLLDHMWRNREELRDILSGSFWKQREQPEPLKLRCFSCHTDPPPTLEAALELRWTELQTDEDDGYVGLCPTCFEREEAPAMRSGEAVIDDTREDQKSLF